MKLLFFNQTMLQMKEHKCQLGIAPTQKINIGFRDFKRLFGKEANYDEK